MPKYRHASIFSAIVLVAAAFLFAAPSTSSAEVIVELSTERLADLDEGFGFDDGFEKGFGTASTGPGLVPNRKLGQPSAETWFFPVVLDTRSPDGPETLFSVRHGSDDDRLVQVDIEFFDPYFQRLSVASATLQPNQIKTFNMRLFADFVPADTVQNGFVRVSPDGPIEVDYFDLDTAGELANGGLALIEDELCTVWNARFLRFGAADATGSQLTFLINGPRGTDLDGPPTIRGEVFDENGEFSNSFTVYTDEWLLELGVLDNLVPDDGPQFGTLRIEVDSFQSPAAAVFAQHAAYGSFSVGGRAVCRSAGATIE